jgi:hypothetical protein
MSSAGTDTIVITIIEYLPEEARSISTAQKTNIVIREVEDLAASVRPRNNMIIGTHER